MTRAEILADARKRFADGQRLDLDWSWARCLATAHAAAKLRKVFEEQRKAQDERSKSRVTGL